MPRGVYNRRNCKRNSGQITSERAKQFWADPKFRKAQRAGVRPVGWRHTPRTKVKMQQSWAKAHNAIKANKGSYESNLESFVCQYADDKGWEHIKLNAAIFAGIPDRLFFLPGGRTELIEFKREDGKGEVSKIQIDVHKRLERLGHKVHVCESRKEAIRILNGK